MDETFCTGNRHRKVITGCIDDFFAYNEFCIRCFFVISVRIYTLICVQICIYVGPSFGHYQFENQGNHGIACSIGWPVVSNFVTSRHIR